MTRMSLKCLSCGYKNEREMDPEEVNEVRNVRAGLVRLDVTEEVLHHVNSFSMGRYGHGRFNLTVDGKSMGMLEVTHDLDDRAILYRGGERK